MTAQHSMLQRYKNAHHLMRGIWSKELAHNTSVWPFWIGNSDCFWYIRDTESGKEFRLVDAKKATNTPAFDHQQLADSLADCCQETLDPHNLPFNNIDLELESQRVNFTAFKRAWSFHLVEGRCEEVAMPLSDQEVRSPDGQWVVFGKDHNLWLRDLETGEETALTQDGEEDYVYGAPGIAWGYTMGCGLQVLWSADSQRIFTVQRDLRQVEALPIVHHVPADGSIRPQLTFQKFGYPSEAHVESARLLAIDVKTGRHQAADYSPLPNVRNNFGLFSGNLGWWHTDNRRAYFVHMDRHYKFARVVEFDTDTGCTRIVLEEQTKTQFNLALNADDKSTLMPLTESNELLWYSERSGWAHLYLYDLETGQLKNTVTSGEWLLRQTLRFDASRREVFAQTAGRVKGRDPYYRDVVRVNIDTGELHEIIAGDHEYVAPNNRDMGTGLSQGWSTHANAVAPSGDYVVLTRSRVDEAPVSLLVGRDGHEVLILEQAALHGLPKNWQWPEPVKLKAADGTTDIYGVVYRPSDFSSTRSYPVVSHTFNQPELPWAPKGSFTNDKTVGMAYLDAAALAELGFIVVQIDGRGTSLREKAFKDHSYGWCPNSSDVADHVAGIQQLVKRYPYMDITRVGITSHTTGGSGAFEGLLNYPDFYQVGTAGCLHDSRLMTATLWRDIFEGDGPNPDEKYPEARVDQLRGKLLMMGGMLDQVAPPATIFRVVEALQKANKDFDLLLLPNLGHDFSGYLTRRAWDYLVEHLMGEEPPKEYRLSGVFGVE